MHSRRSKAKSWIIFYWDRFHEHLRLIPNDRTSQLYVDDQGNLRFKLGLSDALGMELAADKATRDARRARGMSGGGGGRGGAEEDDTEDVDDDRSLLEICLYGSICIALYSSGKLEPGEVKQLMLLCERPVNDDQVGVSVFVSCVFRRVPCVRPMVRMAY